MRKSFVFIILILSFTSLKAQNIFGFWKKLPGPEGGPVSAILVRNDTVYCAGSGGLYRSVDQGESWQNIGLNQLIYVYEMAQNKYFIFIPGRNGAYRFNPRTETVARIPFYGVYSFAAQDSVVLMGTDWGIYKSTDYGLTWKIIEDESRGHEINDILLLSSGVAVASACGASGSQTLRSTDWGDSWTILDPDPIKWCIIELLEIKGGIYAASDQPGDVYISGDGGLHWQLRHGINAPKRYTSAFHYDGIALYLGTDEAGVYKSKDFAKSWYVNNDGIINRHVRAINSTAHYDFLGTTDGIYRKTKTESVWEPRNNGLANQTIQALEEVDGKLFAGTYGSGLQISEDWGMTWYHQTIQSGRNYVYDLKYIGSRIFAIASRNYLYPFGAVLFVSDDLGKSWEYKKFGSLLEKVDGNEKFIIVGSEFGLFRSTDHGNTWKKALNGVPENINVADLAVMDSVGLVVNGTSYVYRSADYGESWQLVRVPGLFSGEAVGAIGNKFYIGSGSVNNVFVSDDYGKSWRRIWVPLSNSSVTDFSGNGKYVFASLSGENGVIASSDSGKYWYRLELGLDNPHVNTILFTRSGHLFLGTNGSSVWRFASAELNSRLISPEENAIFHINKVIFTWHSVWGIDKYRIQIFKDLDLTKPVIDEIVNDTTFTFKSTVYNQRFYYRISSVCDYWANQFTEWHSFYITPPAQDILDQNFPNPFNYETNIRFHLSSESRVKFYLFDINGRLIKNIFDQTKAAGTHQFKFKAEVLSSGIYFLKMKTERASLIKKIVLVR